MIGNIEINKKVEKKYWLKRQALHAEKLEFELYGKNHVFLAELKEDMKKIIDITTFIAKPLKLDFQGKSLGGEVINRYHP